MQALTRRFDPSPFLALLISALMLASMVSMMSTMKRALVVPPLHPLSDSLSFVEPVRMAAIAVKSALNPPSPGFQPLAVPGPAETARLGAEVVPAELEVAPREESMARVESDEPDKPGSRRPGKGKFHKIRENVEASGLVLTDVPALKEAPWNHGQMKKELKELVRT